mmetsp:Transcript_149261/g.479300  ORF Transcript_149261/g.479300 Transcript_149261/m.479300 type:complete len:109 (+) Transcript_149261:115-441(+)
MGDLFHAEFTTTEHFVQLGGFAGMPEVMGSMTRSWQWVKPEQAGEGVEPLPYDAGGLRPPCEGDLGRPLVCLEGGRPLNGARLDDCAVARSSGFPRMFLSRAAEARAL